MNEKQIEEVGLRVLGYFGPRQLEFARELFKANDALKNAASRQNYPSSTKATPAERRAFEAAGYAPRSTDAELDVCPCCEAPETECYCPPDGIAL